ncbi:MAG: Asp-tRNA(Asn)/Glu-tRNA(Gln) amidotransferase subunit GatC [Candidatus Shapirobacteria bacterium]|nr:Asp-tRNA(Asn)/Glu-tRNA(Gln) amidotransferase subunit GatC [Candidatus Shapirobacteria bacterium]
MSSTIITDDQFQHIAKLSRLEIKPEESYIKDQLAQAAKYVDVLKELDTDKVSPTFQVNHKKNVFRDDIITPSFTQSQAISQAPKTKDGYIVTAATIKK